MLSCKSEAETRCRRQQLTQKIHDTRNLRSPRRKDVDYGFIIGAKQNMLTKPQRAPDVRCYDYKKQLLISNGLLGLTRRPSSAKPLSLEVSTETQGASSVGSDLQVRGSWHAWIKPKAHPMPRRKKFMPPLKVQMKFRVQTDGMVPAMKAAQKVYHSSKKGAPRPDHFGSMMQMANKGLQLSDQLPQSH